MLKYGSCPRGCGASVAFDSAFPDIALDGIVPHNTDGTPCPHLCGTVDPSPTEIAQAIMQDHARAAGLTPQPFLGGALAKAADDYNGAVRKITRDVIAGRIAPRIDAQSTAPRVMSAAQRSKLLESACRTIIEAIGDDPKRVGLADTPQRFARMMIEFFDGHADDNAAVDEPRVFEHDTVDQLVIVDRLDVWSMCEHHLLPFSMSVDVGYIARGRVLGLSKFGRIARRLAARLTMQERYVEALADAIVKATGSADVIVVARGEHLCMMMRGPRMGHRVSSAALRGAFREDAPARAEFYSLVTRR